MKWSLRLLLFVLFFQASLVQAQEKKYRFRSLGAVVGYGVEAGIKEKYRPLFVAGDLCWQMGRGEKKNFFAFYTEPQFNLVRTDAGTDYEFGSNIGLRYIKRMGQSFVYGMLGSGPHYISARLQRQASGFIFSDNLGIGWMRPLKKDKPLALHLQFIGRHISNANFVMPNGGINTLNFRVGLSGIR